MADQRFCDACGKPNREQARFCGYCGQLLENGTLKKDGSFQKARELGRGAPHDHYPLQIGEPALNESYQGSTVSKTIKLLSFIIVMVALLGLLAYTNPTLESYESFVHQKIIQEAQGNDVNQALGYFLGGFASRFLASQTIRKDYIFLSIYETNIGDEHLKALGILKNFILLETPRSPKAQN